MASRTPPGRLTVSLVRCGDLDVVRAAGDLDVASAGPFLRALGELTADRAGPGLVDLREVQFMDSSGVYHLLNAHRRLTRQGREFSVRCSPGQVQHLFATLRLEDTLNVSCLDRSDNGHTAELRT